MIARTTASRPAPATPAQSAEVPLDLTTIGIICDRLRQARLDLEQAYLHARGHSEASRTVAAAGRSLRNTLDVFEAAYTRGRL